MENNQNTPPAVATPKISRAAALLNKVAGGEVVTPPKMDVIKETVPPSIPASIPSVPEKTSVEEEIQYDIEATSTPTVEVKKGEAVPIEDAPETDNENTVLRSLRSRARELKKTAKEKEAEAAALRQKVTEYESGLAIPEFTQQQVARIEELEVYEKLHNFKASPVYKEKYVKPIKEEQDKLVSLAESYGVKPEVLNAAFAATTEAETNRILSQHFKDSVGALKAATSLETIKKIQSAAMEAEKEPAQMLTRMQEENDRIVRDQRARANEAIVNVSKDAWTESLIELRQDTRFPELSYREGDTEHNNMVRDLSVKAASEFGKFIKGIVHSGATEMPKDLGFALARANQLAHVSAVLARERARLAVRVKELESLVHDSHVINRPGVNGSGTRGVNGAAPKAVGPEAAGRNVLNRVMGTQK